MKFLLDVNILIAWGWSDHDDHLRVQKWIAQIRGEKSTLILTSPNTQLGFIRISTQRSLGEISLSEASQILSEMIHFWGDQHQFITDSIDSLHFPEWCHSPKQTTDAHLLKLAQSQQAKLATLDQKIPDAFLIPQPKNRR